MEEEEQKFSIFRPLTQAYLDVSRKRGILPKTVEQEACTPQNEIQESQIFLESESLLPKSMQKIFPLELINLPLQDPDGYYEDKQTYATINGQKKLYRFNSSDSCWLFGPLNHLRKCTTRISIHKWFQILMLIVIMIEISMMAALGGLLTMFLRLAFFGIYFLEAIIKIISQGFVREHFSYLRNSWNVMDFLLTFLLPLSLVLNLGGFAGLTALRGLRFMTIQQRYRLVVATLRDTFINLKEFYILFLFVFFLLSVFGLQVSMGTLNQKCSKTPNSKVSDIEFHNFIHRSENWFESDGSTYKICGNETGTWHCPKGYTCFAELGENPDYGLTNFDHFGWSTLSVLRVITRDFWEDIASMVIQAKGPWFIIYFLVTIFIGSFCLINYITAVVVVSFDLVKKKDAFKDEKEYDETVGIILDSQFYPKNSSPQIEGERVQEVRENTSRLFLLSKRFCSWDYNACLIKFRKMLHYIMFDPFTEVLIYILIITYTILLALDKTDMNDKYARKLSHGYQFFIIIFFLEITLKLIAASPFEFFKDRYNTLDLLTVYPASLVYVFEAIDPFTAHYISFMKMFVLFRSLKLVKLFCIATYFPNFHRVIYTYKRSWRDFSEMGLVPIFFCAVFGAIGMCLFSDHFVLNTQKFHEGIMPRWNFNGFVNSFCLVFRILGGEWIETLWDCLYISEWTCIPFYLFVLVVGNFMMVNVFLALLLSNYGPVNQLSADEVEYLDIFKVGLERIKKLFKPKPSIAFHAEETIKNANDNYLETPVLQETEIQLSDQEKSSSENNPNMDIFDSTKKEDSHVVVNCCPDFRILSLVNEERNDGYWKTWKDIRQKCLFVTRNVIFQYIVRAVILVSLILMIQEDKHLKDKPQLESAVYHLMRIFCFLYVVEMFIKLLGLGFWSFVKNISHSIDFISVLLFAFGLISNNSFLKACLSLRILHFLNDLRKYQNMKVILNTLKNALPSFFAALLVQALFSLFLTVFGVQTLGGKFYYCQDKSGRIFNKTFVPNKWTCFNNNGKWLNHAVNFDNTLDGFFAMLEVAIFKGWIQIYHSILDSTAFYPGANIVISYGLIVIIMYQSFLFIKLFIVVLLDSFKSEMRKEIEAPLTSKSSVQRNYYQTIATIRNLKPPRTIPKPEMKPCLLAYDLVTNSKFEIGMLCVIMINILLMAINESSNVAGFILQPLSYIFMTIYIMEFLIKLAAWRQHFINEAWNIYDAIVVFYLIIGTAASSSASPFLLVIFRALKIFRIIRFSKYTKGLQNIYHTICSCLSPFLHISIVLFTVIFIFATFGMFLFKNLEHRDAINEIYNFETFGRALLSLIQISTTDAWDGFLHGLIYEKPRCFCRFDDICECGNYARGAIFMLSYLYVVSFGLINMFIVVSIYQYCQAFVNLKFGISHDKYDDYFETWKSFDLFGTGFLSLKVLPDFLKALSDPFTTPDDKTSVIAAMDLPIHKDETVKYNDILEGLAKMYFEKQEAGLLKFPLIDSSGTETEPLPTTSQLRKEEN